MLSVCAAIRCITAAAAAAALEVKPRVKKQTAKCPPFFSFISVDLTRFLTPAVMKEWKKKKNSQNSDQAHNAASYKGTM